MTEKQAIDLLRHALAAVWTAVEYEHENFAADAWQIAEEALHITKEWATGKVPSDTTGLESWKEYLQRKNVKVEEF